MEQMKKIPEQFFGLFQSKNRYVYMEALLLIYDEYLYNDYFLSKDTCIQILHDHFYNRIFELTPDEEEQEADVTESIATRIFSRLLYFKWLRKVEDYQAFKTNVVIPDYASIFIEAFQKVEEPEGSQTDLYIQNVYANIYSFYYDKKAGIELLKTAMINTSNLNRALQDLLHNMDKFFESLLKQDTYETLLQEHLYGYVEHIVDKKYGLLKTSDNFYIYKNDIKKLLRAVREDEERITLLKRKMIGEGKREEDVELEIEEILDAIERGITSMEKRIVLIDGEHTKYVRATVSRLEYLLNNDENVTGQVVQLLNLCQSKNQDEILSSLSAAIPIYDNTILQENLLYKKRGRRKSFEDTVEEEVEAVELSKEDILRANYNKQRYSVEQICDYVESHMVDGVYATREHPITSTKDFELLILAYDYSLRKKSGYDVEVNEGQIISNGMYSYPDVTFHKKNTKQ